MILLVGILIVSTGTFIMGLDIGLDMNRTDKHKKEVTDDCSTEEE